MSSMPPFAGAAASAGPQSPPRPTLPKPKPKPKKSVYDFESNGHLFTIESDHDLSGDELAAIAREVRKRSGITYPQAEIHNPGEGPVVTPDQLRQLSARSPYDVGAAKGPNFQHEALRRNPPVTVTPGYASNAAAESTKARQRGVEPHAGTLTVNRGPAPDPERFAQDLAKERAGQYGQDVGGLNTLDVIGDALAPLFHLSSDPSTTLHPGRDPEYPTLAKKQEIALGELGRRLADIHAPGHIPVAEAVSNFVDNLAPGQPIVGGQKVTAGIAETLLSGPAAALIPIQAANHLDHFRRTGDTESLKAGLTDFVMSVIPAAHHLKEIPAVARGIERLKLGLGHVPEATIAAPVEGIRTHEAPSGAPRGPEMQTYSESQPMAPRGIERVKNLSQSQSESGVQFRPNTHKGELREGQRAGLGDREVTTAENLTEHLQRSIDQLQEKAKTETAEPPISEGGLSLEERAANERHYRNLLIERYGRAKDPIASEFAKLDPEDPRLNPEGDAFDGRIVAAAYKKHIAPDAPVHDPWWLDPEISAKATAVRDWLHSRTDEEAMRSAKLDSGQMEEELRWLNDALKGSARHDTSTPEGLAAKAQADRERLADGYYRVRKNKAGTYSIDARNPIQFVSYDALTPELTKQLLQTALETMPDDLYMTRREFDQMQLHGNVKPRRLHEMLSSDSRLEDLGAGEGLHKSSVGIPRQIVEEYRNALAAELKRLKAESVPLNEGRLSIQTDRQHPMEEPVPVAPVPPEETLPHGGRQEDLNRSRSTMGQAGLTTEDTRPWSALLEKAKPQDARALSDRKAWSDQDNVNAITRLAQIKVEHRDLLGQVAKATGDDLEHLGRKIFALEDEHAELTEKMYRAGSEQGRALASRKLMIGDDMDAISLVSEAKAKAKAAGHELTPRQEGVLRKIASDWETRYAELEKARMRDAERALKMEMGQIGQSLRSSARRVSVEAIRAERGPLLEAIRKDLAQLAISPVSHVLGVGGGGGADLSALSTNLRKLLKGYVSEGLLKAGDGIDKFVSLVKEHIGDEIPEQAIYDALASPVERRTKSEAAKLRQGLMAEAKARSTAAMDARAAKSEVSPGKRKALEAKAKRAEDIANKIEAQRQETREKKEALRVARESSAEWRYNERRAKELLDEANKIGEQLDRGEFPSKPEPRFKKDPGVQRLEGQLQELRRRRVDAMAALNRKWYEKAGSVVNAARAAQTGFDQSFVGKQGALAFWLHPKLGAKAAGKGTLAWTRANAAKIGAELRELPNWKDGTYSRMGLATVETEGPRLTRREEMYMTDLWDKLEGQGVLANKGDVGYVPRKAGQAVGGLIKGSERSYGTAANVLRTGMADKLLNMAGGPRGLTKGQLEALGHTVNVFTGRGTFGRYDASVPFLAQLLFAPRYYASRLEFLSGTPLWRGIAADVAAARESGGIRAFSPRASRAIAAEYAKFGAGVFLVYQGAMYAKSQGADIDINLNDTTRSDFGQLRIGNRLIDLLGGIHQFVILTGRLATHMHTSNTGVQRYLDEDRREEDKKAGNAGKYYHYSPSESDVAMDFARKKSSPVLGAAVDIYKGKNVIGQPVDVGGAVGSRLVPMSVRDLQEALEHEGLSPGAIYALMGLFGFSSRPVKYDDQPQAEKP